MAELNAGTAYIEVRPDLTKFGKQLNSGVKRSTSGLGRSVKRATQIGAVALAGFGAVAIKTAAEFDTTMRTIGAVASVPLKPLEKLREAAIQQGRATVFSANEAAQAELELSKAGIRTADILGGGLKQTLSLASAGALDLANAATITANAMNVFGLKGSQAQQAADALSGAANASSANVADLAEALAQGGNAAAAAGLSIQETTAVLAAFADQGIRGSDAGTSLKTFMLSIVPTTNKAKDAVRDLGLQFIDTQGNIRPITEIADELKTKLGKLTQAQQQVALKTIFGTDAFRAANILMNEGAVGLERYIKATSKVGNAQKVASARMGGFAGLLENLKGSIETVALGVGQALLPVLSQLVKAFTPLVNSLGPVVAALGKALTPVIAALSKALGPVLEALAPILVGLSPVLAELGRALGKTLLALVPLLKPLGDLLIAIAPLLPLIVEVINLALVPLVPPLAALIAIIAKIVKVIVRWVVNFRPLRGLLLALLSPISAIITAVTWLAKRWSDSFRSIGRSVQTAWNFVKKWGGNILNWFRELPGKAAGFIASLPGKIGDVFKNMVNTIIGWWNRLDLGIPGFDLNLPGPLPDVHFGGIGDIIPDVPTLDSGGIIRRPTLAMLAMNNVPEAVTPLGAEGRLHVIVDNPHDFGNDNENVRHDSRAGRMNRG